MFCLFIYFFCINLINEYDFYNFLHYNSLPKVLMWLFLVPVPILISSILVLNFLSVVK